MAKSFTKIIPGKTKRGFGKIGILTDDGWVELPPIRNASVKFVREILEKELAISFNRLNNPITPLENPSWTGPELKVYRSRSGLSSTNFGRIIGVSISTINTYEHSNELPLYVSGSLQYLAKKSIVDADISSGRLEQVIEQVKTLQLTSEEVKAVRKKLGYTQETFGKIIFISRKQVSQLENYPVSICQSLHLRYFIEAFL